VEVFLLTVVVHLMLVPSMDSPVASSRQTLVQALAKGHFLRLVVERGIWAEADSLYRVAAVDLGVQAWHTEVSVVEFREPM
jgi:hypothetical protein